MNTNKQLKKFRCRMPSQKVDNLELIEYDEQSPAALFGSFHRPGYGACRVAHPDFVNKVVVKNPSEPLKKRKICRIPSKSILKRSIKRSTRNSSYDRTGDCFKNGDAMKIMKRMWKRKEKVEEVQTIGGEKDDILVWIADFKEMKKRREEMKKTKEAQKRKEQENEGLSPESSTSSEDSSDSSNQSVPGLHPMSSSENSPATIGSSEDNNEVQGGEPMEVDNGQADQEAEAEPQGAPAEVPEQVFVEREPAAHPPVAQVQEIKEETVAPEQEQQEAPVERAPAAAHMNPVRPSNPVMNSQGKQTEKGAPAANSPVAQAQEIKQEVSDTQPEQQEAHVERAHMNPEPPSNPVGYSGNKLWEKKISKSSGLQQLMEVKKEVEAMDQDAPQEAPQVPPQQKKKKNQNGREREVNQIPLREVKQEIPEEEENVNMYWSQKEKMEQERNHPRVFENSKQRQETPDFSLFRFDDDDRTVSEVDSEEEWMDALAAVEKTLTSEEVEDVVGTSTSPSVLVATSSTTESTSIEKEVEVLRVRASRSRKVKEVNQSRCPRCSFKFENDAELQKHLKSKKFCRNHVEKLRKPIEREEISWENPFKCFCKEFQSSCEFQLVIHTVDKHYSLIKLPNTGKTRTVYKSFTGKELKNHVKKSMKAIGEDNLIAGETTEEVENWKTYNWICKFSSNETSCPAFIKAREMEDGTSTIYSFFGHIHNH